MARQEKPVDPTAGPLQQFAHDLRQLRGEAGNPDYRALAKTAGYSATTLFEAARGTQLPTVDVVLAYVRACRGDVDAWKQRWLALKEQVDGGSRLASQAATAPAAGAVAPSPWPAMRTPNVHSVAEQRAAQSNPLVERAATWQTVLGTVISLVFGVTQQRPASTVARSIGLAVVLAGVVVFVTIATTKDGLRRFPAKVRRGTLVVSAALGVVTATAFAVPTSREVVVHAVLGFPSVSQQVRIADVNVPKRQRIPGRNHRSQQAAYRRVGARRGTGRGEDRMPGS